MIIDLLTTALDQEEYLKKTVESLQKVLVWWLITLAVLVNQKPNKVCNQIIAQNVKMLLKQIIDQVKVII